MKHFRLADAIFRKNTDLRYYRQDIEKAVKKVKPMATVDVHKHYFTTTPDLEKMESIEVSAFIRGTSELKQFTMYRPCLFSSTRRLSKKEMEVDYEDNRTIRNKMGGRKRNSRKISAVEQESNKKIN